MTHEEMTEFLTGGDSFILDEGDDAEIADRLDRYRSALIEAKRQMDEMAEVLWGIRPDVPRGTLTTDFIDEALK
jgi:hypothetical protein